MLLSFILRFKKGCKRKETSYAKVTNLSEGCFRLFLSQYAKIFQLLKFLDFNSSSKILNGFIERLLLKFHICYIINGT